MPRLVTWFAFVLLVGCGGSDTVPESSDDAPAPALGCESAADCHYDDMCMPSACQLEAPPEVVCEESAPPPGPCACVESRCEIVLPDVAEPDCTADADCHYDDPCAATGCTSEPIPGAECVGPHPPPGGCACVEGRCALRPPPATRACSSDADCFYDNPCAATACTTEAPPADLACAESWPPRGDCHCLAGRCAMQRFEPTRSDAECSLLNPCGFVLANGSCLPGQADESAAVPEGGATPICRCRASHCRGGWVEPVSCTDVADCWVESGPLGPVPVARPRARRGRRFRVCSDGEVPPACVEGRCALGPPAAC